MAAGGRSILKGLARQVVGLGLLAAGVATVPAWWCGQWAGSIYDGEPKLQAALARGVAEHVKGDLSAAAYQTGSKRFNGEWLFGTYMMGAMGFGQSIQAQPQRRDEYLPLMQRCIERIMEDDVKAFDVEAWGSDPLTTLDTDQGHAAYLGYLNLALGVHRKLQRESRFADLHDRITAALVRRVEASPTLLIETYPHETYPVDNAAVIGSLALHGETTGRDYRALIERWTARCRRDYIDGQSGLLIQAVDASGRAQDAARGSGTFLAVYFLAHADRQLSRELFEAGKRELFDEYVGFGMMREYPRGQGGWGDIDSGPVVLGYGVSATGFALAGCRMFGDRDAFVSLYRTTYLFGAPTERSNRINHVSGGPLGDAILFAMFTIPPLDTKREASPERDKAGGRASSNDKEAVR